MSSLLLGLLASLGNSIVAACVGYWTLVFGCPRFYFKALVVLNAAPTASVSLTAYDKNFDGQYSQRVLWWIRALAPSAGLALGLLCLGEANTEALTLLAVAVIGTCAGLVNYLSLSRQHGTEREVMVSWAGIAAGGLVALLLVEAVGFHASASVATYLQLCRVAAVVTGLLALPLLAGPAEAKEAAPLVDRVSKPSWAAPLQFGNLFLTLLPMPLLPAAVPADFAQDLVLWKLLIEAIASAAQFSVFAAGVAGSLHLSELARTVVLALRALGLVWAGHALWGDPAMAVARPAALVAVWDLFVLAGFLVSQQNDIGASPEQLRKNRVAHYSGIVLAIVVAGAVLYGPAGSVEATCPSCPALVPVVPAEHFRCGASGGNAAGARQVLSYGANLDCDKLAAMGVAPLDAEFATLDGYCLEFATNAEVAAPGEPGFLTLVPCDGCVQGVVHTLGESDFAKVVASEPGYRLQTVPAVVGGTQRDVEAFVMRNPQPSATSERYAGKVFCARRKLGAAVERQLECELADEGLGRPECPAPGEFKFLPK